MLPEIAILIAFAILMGITMAIVVFLSQESKTKGRNLLIYIVLLMMNGMLIGPLIYYSGIISISVQDAYVLTAGIMAFEMIIPVFSLFSVNKNENPVNKGVVITLTILDEYLMGLLFTLIQKDTNAISFVEKNFPLSFISPLYGYWFILPMALEMFLTVNLSRKKLRPSIYLALLLQASAMIFIPSEFSGLWVPLSVYISGTLMTALFIVIFEIHYRKKYVLAGTGRYFLLLFFIYTLMMAGVSIYQEYGDAYLLGLSVVTEMILYFTYILDYRRFEGGRKIQWMGESRYSTALLALIFSSEFFMGLTFDFQFYGVQVFLGALSLAPYSNNIFMNVIPFLYNFTVFFGGVALSPFYLIMMGFEMGALVVFKIKESKNVENRIRMVLMICAYGLYSIVFPSFVFPNNSKIPFLGWSMGIGTSGGLAVSLAIPMLLTYAISGTLSFLFGSRQLCSVFCTAPLMYQGTFYDSFKNFNRKGKASKVNRTQQRNKIYRLVSLAVYSVIAIGGIASILNQYFGYNIRVYGTGILSLTYIILFGIIWYVIFVLMPYAGSYGCINTGYCHWGNFNRFISKFGFFKLKVKSSDICRTCKTKECTQACPVGITYQPGSFISKGEFKDVRCVGVGECVEACPYQNIMFYDVRGWLKEKLGRGRDR
ncbi:4Fe-4S binding protein [Caldiplasma sukawensis]